METGGLMHPPLAQDLVDVVGYLTALGPQLVSRREISMRIQNEHPHHVRFRRYDPCYVPRRLRKNRNFGPEAWPACTRTGHQQRRGINVVAQGAAPD